MYKENNTMKRQATEWKEIFANYPSHRRLISRIYKEHKTNQQHKINNNGLIKKCGLDLNTDFSNYTNGQQVKKFNINNH